MSISQQDRDALIRGNVPSGKETLSQLSCGQEPILDFWIDRYLKEYIPAGGSKIRFVTGRKGSGKTHFLRRLCYSAEELDYFVAQISAKEVWLHDFSELYKETICQCDLRKCLEGCSKQIIKNMGYDPDEIPEGMTFVDYLSENNDNNALTKRTIRLELKKMFMDNAMLDNNFALACSLLTGGILGHPVLEERNRELLLEWLHGEKTVKMTLLRVLGLSPVPISKFNARYMFRSLSEVIRMSGSKGMLIVIDDLDTLLNKSGSGTIHYTKLRRDDTYEIIRQMIDDIDSLRNVMIVYGFDRALIDNDNYGIKSYQALWMRIQNEIRSEKFNYFSDITDMDHYNRQEITREIAAGMAVRFNEALDSLGLPMPVPETEEIEQLLEKAKTSAKGIPALVVDCVLGVSEDV